MQNWNMLHKVRYEKYKTVWESLLIYYSPYPPYPAKALLYSFSDLDKKHFLWIDHQEFKHNNSIPNKTRLNLINYRENWKVISFQYIQLKPVQKIKQNGTKDLLYSSVEEKVATPVYQTKTSQSCCNFVTHLKLYPSNKVNLWETLQITLYYVFVNEQSKKYMLTQVVGRSLIFVLSALSTIHRSQLCAQRLFCAGIKGFIFQIRHSVQSSESIGN